MSKYPMSHVLLERKCPDTSVRITLVWVTGDTHPVQGMMLFSSVAFLYNTKSHDKSLNRFNNSQ